MFKFPVFNQVQTKCFPIVSGSFFVRNQGARQLTPCRQLWLSDDNAVISAPTGAGKTVLFEIALLKALQADSEAQAVYIAPTKSLCTERYNDWLKRLKPIFKHGITQKSEVVVELTGDSGFDALKNAKEARLM